VAEPAAGRPADLEEAFERAARVLRGARSVALACHVNPDADALGSMLGLAAFLRARGGFVNPSFDPASSRLG